MKRYTLVENENIVLNVPADEKYTENMPIIGVEISRIARMLSYLKFGQLFKIQGISKWTQFLAKHVYLEYHDHEDFFY